MTSPNHSLIQESPNWQYIYRNDQSVQQISRTMGVYDWGIEGQGLIVQNKMMQRLRIIEFNSSFLPVSLFLRCLGFDAFPYPCISYHYSWQQIGQTIETWFMGIIHNFGQHKWNMHASQHRNAQINCILVYPVWHHTIYILPHHIASHRITLHYPV